MLRIRIFTAAAVAAIVASAPLTAPNATAQTSGQAGTPLALLAGLNPPHQKTTAVHANRTIVQAKTARKTPAHKSGAKIARKPTATPARAIVARQSIEPQKAWPAPEQPAASEAGAAAAADTAPAAKEPPRSEMIVDGQTVPVAAPDTVNDIDLAAGDQSAAVNTTTPSIGADDQTAAARALAASVHEDASPVGSASWIAQVLAALGGAIAAGLVAWFLIGSSAQRAYG